MSVFNNTRHVHMRVFNVLMSVFNNIPMYPKGLTQPVVANVVGHLASSVTCAQLNPLRRGTLVYSNKLGMSSMNVGKHPLGFLVTFSLEKCY